MLPNNVEQWSAQQILEWLLEQFPGKVALACSFQKEETVLLDMLFALDPQARVFGIDTHYLFPETYAHWREVEQRYGTTIEVFEARRPRSSLCSGETVWETNPDLYLAVAKIGRWCARWVTSTPGSQASAATSRRRGECPEARVGRAARALEGEPARRLERRGLLGVHPERRPPLQRAARPGLRVDRRHALDAARRRARGPLGGDRQGRVRHPHGRDGRREGAPHLTGLVVWFTGLSGAGKTTVANSSRPSWSSAVTLSTTSTGTSCARTCRRAWASRRESRREHPRIGWVRRASLEREPR